MRKIHATVILLVMESILINGFSKDVFKAGIAKVDITPTESLYMGGYDQSGRMGPSDGVFGKIYVRAIVFDDDIERVAFIELDVVSLPKENYLSVRKLIATETGLPVENIMLGCVHNHAAPYPGSKNTDSEWYKHLNDNIIKAVKYAIDDLEPVKIGGAFGRSAIAMNRRKIMDDTISFLSFDENYMSQSYGAFETDTPVKIREMEGVCRLGANPEGSIDDAVGIMRIDKLSGQPKAVFINYACHGTSLGARNNKISPEWNGHMLEYVEKMIPGVTGIFAQGAAGDINPTVVGGLEGYIDNLENTALLGYEIGKEVVQVFSGIKTDHPVNSRILVVNHDIVCPLKYDEVVKDFIKTTIAIPVSAIRIGEFVFVTFPGELFHSIGQDIKTMTHSMYPFILGYCNGSFGYLPTQFAYSQGGYEPWASRFAPVTEKIFMEGIEKMMIEVFNMSGDSVIIR